MDFVATTHVSELASELGVYFLSLALYEFDEIDPEVPITLEYRDKEVIALYGNFLENEGRYASYKMVTHLDISDDILTFPEERDGFEKDDILIVSRDAHDQDNVIFRIRRL